MSEQPKPLLDRLGERAAGTRAGAFFYVHIAPPIDRRLLKWTGGRLTTGGRGRVGFLRVKGAKSGIERVTPLVYTRDEDNVLLVASRGGDVKHPAWYRNIVANPEVTFAIDGDQRAYTAHEATPEERPRLWDLVVHRYAGYAVYARRCGDRQIPVMVLSPR